MTKIVLVGAGSLQFGAGMLGDIFTSRALDGAEIVLNDINEAAAMRTLKMTQDYIQEKNYTHKVSVSTDLREGLKGADFVVISIEVGDRFALWDMDWRIPQQYGIRQVYGENGGPGGLFHSLRIIPPILEICGKVMEVAPEATIFNYSNPMSRITTTVHRAYPGIKFIGMCHEIASLERHLAPLLGRKREDIHFRAAGLNHFSVLASVKDVQTGEELYDEVREKAPAYFARQIGYSEIYQASKRTGKAIDTEGWMEIDTSELGEAREWSDRWLFRDVLKTFGVLPITYDSHFGEYIGWAHDASDHRGILDFYSYYRNYLGAITPKIKEELHERVVPIMEAMVTGEAYEEAAVNIPNNGLIEDLPSWIAVEVPAIIEKSGPQGIKVELTPGFRGLLSNQIGIHNMTAEAILHKSRDMVIQALLVDPVVDVSKPIVDMVDHMIAEQSPWLDYLS